MPTRYWANLVAATLTMIIALAAGLVIPILAVLPKSYVFALGGTGYHRIPPRCL
jgi:predicted benzoate:H+ symporter BenE